MDPRLAVVVVGLAFHPALDCALEGSSWIAAVVVLSAAVAAVAQADFVVVAVLVAAAAVDTADTDHAAAVILSDLHSDSVHRAADYQAVVHSQDMVTLADSCPVGTDAAAAVTLVDTGTASLAHLHWGPFCSRPRVAAAAAYVDAGVGNYPVRDASAAVVGHHQLAFAIY